LAPQQLLEGTAEQYQCFLDTSSKASLIDISTDFNFQIRTLETPSLLLRDVTTRGQASNQSTYSDAFFGLMLSHGPGGFSTDSALPAETAEPQGPSLHWHWPNCLAFSHHRDSHVTYLRLESGGLLRQLAIHQLRLEQLHSLQAAAAPPSLVSLITALRHQLLTSTGIGQRQQVVDAFMTALGLELRTLLKRPGETSSASARHVAAAIERLSLDLSASTSLVQLASDLALTPRAVQACFASRLGISPMRWLKLARFSRLRQSLHGTNEQHLSLQQLMRQVGLSASTLNRVAYREVYRVSPAEDLARGGLDHLADAEQSSRLETFHFNALEAAISALQTMESQWREGTNHGDLAISICIANSSKRKSS
jgi:AraC-like DNA-binding protein